METSAFVSDAELNDYLQAANRELYYYLVQKYEKHFVFTYKFQHFGDYSDVTWPVPLPRDNSEDTTLTDDISEWPGFYKLLTIYRHPLVSGWTASGSANIGLFPDPLLTGEYTQLYPIGLEEEGYFLNPRRTGPPTNYVLFGKFIAGNTPDDPITPANMYIQPYPFANSGYMYVVRYVPVCPRLAESLGASFNPYMTGGDEFIVISAAIKMKDKEESDVSTLMQEREMLLQRLEGALTPVDAGMYEQVRQHRAPPRNWGFTDYLDEIG